MTTSYHNKDRLMQVECNECGKIEVYYGTFTECIKQVKEDGWIITRPDGDYFHFHNEKCLRLNKEGSK